MNCHISYEYPPTRSSRPRHLSSAIAPLRTVQSIVNVFFLFVLRKRLTFRRGWRWRSRARARIVENFLEETWREKGEIEDKGGKRGDHTVASKPLGYMKSSYKIWCELNGRKNERKRC